jgi:hypothetical protein
MVDVGVPLPFLKEGVQFHWRSCKAKFERDLLDAATKEEVLSKGRKKQRRKAVM